MEFCTVNENYTQPKCFSKWGSIEINKWMRQFPTRIKWSSRCLSSRRLLLISPSPGRACLEASCPWPEEEKNWLSTWGNLKFRFQYKPKIYIYWGWIMHIFHIRIQEKIQMRGMGFIQFKNLRVHLTLHTGWARLKLFSMWRAESGL